MTSTDRQETPAHLGICHQIPSFPTPGETGYRMKDGTRNSCSQPCGFAWLLLVVLFTSQSFAAFGFKLDGTLDKDAISHAYFEGEFNKVLPPLEMYRQSVPANSTREDSIFVFKYLSVIYAAEPSTRARAESYMVQLLKLMPTIELIDLYISDNIQAIFKDVKKSFMEQQEYVREHDQFGRPIPDSSRTGDGKSSNGRKSSRKWVWWTLGGVGTAAVATTAYYTLRDDGDPKPTRVGITPR